MSKIFSLRKWLYLEDACKHLTERFNEAVSTSDVLALALEGCIPLSVRFEGSILVRAARIVYDKPVGGYSAGYATVGREPRTYLALSRSVDSLDAVFDLPMIGGEREYVRGYEWHGKDTVCIPFDEIVLRSEVGELFVLVTSKGYEATAKPYHSWENYGFEYEFPSTARLVLRTKAMLALESSLQSSAAEKPLIPRERTNLLNIIGALLELNGGKEAGIIGELLEKYPEKPGIKKRTLEEKFAEAKRSLSGA